MPAPRGPFEGPTAALKVPCRESIPSAGVRVAWAGSSQGRLGGPVSMGCGGRLVVLRPVVCTAAFLGGATGLRRERSTGYGRSGGRSAEHFWGTALRRKAPTGPALWRPPFSFCIV